MSNPAKLLVVIRGIIRAVEFETVVKNGHIAVPKECQEMDGHKVRVLVLLEEERKEGLIEKNSFIGKFVKHPLKIDSFAPMSRNDIYEYCDHP